MGKLSGVFVRTVKPTDKITTYGDGRGGYGLMLRVLPSGRKLWQQRIILDGKPSHLGLGGYPLVTLAEARETALGNARAVRKGSDPRKPRRTPTVADYVDSAIALQRSTWKNPARSEREWRNVVNLYASGIVGKPVSAVSAADAKALLAPLWESKRETGRKLKQRLSVAFRIAVNDGHIASNPFDTVGAVLPKRKTKPTQHHAAIPYAAVADALDTVNAGERTWLGTKLAFRFLVLTATRSGEVRGARWDEIDGAVWTIPAARMKAASAHAVPLSKASLAVLEQARAIMDGSDLLFPSARGKQMSDSTLSKLLRENDIGAVPHGFRSSFRDWARVEAKAQRDVIEVSLAHTERNAVVAAYARSDLLDERRELMQQWGNYLCGE